MTPVLEKALRVAGVPEKLLPLYSIAHDLRWSWRPELRALFETVDADAWRRAGGNPVLWFREVPPERLAAAGDDHAYRDALARAARRLEEEDAAPPAHPAARELAARGERIAYFSAEFGVTEVLPIYAGGLGVLAGDHLKSASDLGMPLCGVGLFYREGYFRQLLDPEGRQAETNPSLDPDELPLCLAHAPDGTPLTVAVDLAGRTVRLLIRIARVGRVPLLLLDSDVAENAPEDRHITARLYGGGHEMRLEQEIVLGIGGSRALERVGLWPTIRHINEGHAAFVSLEKIRQLISDEGLSFAAAREVAAAGNVFTTHTPIPAGIDVFTPDLLVRYFGDYVGQLGISFDAFFELGRELGGERRELFSMAVLAMRLSTHQNAVSRLHAAVSRRLWRGVAPDVPPSELPIDPITNGVHGATWTAPEIAATGVRDRPETVDRAALWARHEELRARVVEVCRARAAEERRSRGASDEEIAEAGRVLDSKALTIGFARRFATYKRATLLFRQPKRLEYLLHQIGRPVQILYAGKAHPRDDAGKEFLHAVTTVAELPEFRGRIIFLPDYDIALARTLVAGCDVWLNTPERTREASGTSGMKAAMNGGLNLSVLDGWWDEAPHEESGFAIGDATDGTSDDAIAQALFDALENRVLPMFFDRDASGLPQAWIDRMIAAASTVARRFSSDRMVAEYAELCYLPGAARRRVLKENDRAPLKELVAWKERLESVWNDVAIETVEVAPQPSEILPGEPYQIRVGVKIASLAPEELVVELFEGPVAQDGTFEAGDAFPLTLAGRDGERAFFSGTHRRSLDPTGGYGVRVRPWHENLADITEPGRMLWWGGSRRAIPYAGS